MERCRPLEKILSRENLNRAYKRVKANKGALGIDGMTIENVLPWPREHREELLESIRREVEAPAGTQKGNTEARWWGRKLEIPTVIDHIIQQAIEQQLVPIYKPGGAANSASLPFSRHAGAALCRKRFLSAGY